MSFLPDEQRPNWIGMLGFCWCGQPYRLDGGELVRLERPHPDERVLDLRDSAPPVVVLTAGPPDERDAGLGGQGAGAAAVEPAIAVDPVTAHELLGALAAIQGLVEVVSEGALDEEASAALLAAARGRIASVVGQVENLARGLPADVTQFADRPGPDRQGPHSRDRRR